MRDEKVLRMDRCYLYLRLSMSIIEDKDVLGAPTIITRQTMISNAAYVRTIETMY